MRVVFSLVQVGVCGCLLLLWGMSACGAPTPQIGAEGGACYGNGTCDGSLQCAGGTCQGSAKEATGEVAKETPAPDAPPQERAPAERPVTPSDAGPTDSTSTPEIPKDDKFSFFVTSLEAMQKLSGSKDGFGGDLGGLEGADRICQTIAAGVGYGHKVWRAFISVTKGPNGQPVHAIDRVGQGPWYDRNGRLISKDLAGLTSGERPAGDAQAVNDLPNEHGQGQLQFGDNHDTVTGSNAQGRLNNTALNSTCQDWTSKIGPGSESKVMIGHSWPRSAAGGMGGRGGAQWIADHMTRGCSAGINLKQDGPGTGDCIGCGGGYGGLYCFALNGTTYKEAGTKCTKDGDCGANQRCFVGYCLAKPSGCQSDSECASGKVCLQSATGVACSDPPPPCTSNASCERGEVCNTRTGKCESGRPPRP